MKGLRLVGDYALEFLVITLLLALSAFLIVPFAAMLVGVVGFFQNDIDSRRFKDIFTTIGRNWKILIFYTIFQLIIVLFPVLNIYFFNTHAETMNYFVLAVSYIALVVGIFYLTTSPTVICNMNVNFRELLYNGLMLLFGNLISSIVAVLCVVGVIALILYYPYVVPLTLYVVPYVNARLMKENFYNLKAKAMDTSVYELKKQEKSDDYLDEFGKIKRESENTEIEDEKN